MAQACTTSADQAAGDLEDDGGDILAAEEVLAILERLRGKPVFGPQSFSEGTETGAIGGEQIGREACVRQAALIRFHHASRIPGNDEFARGTLQSVRSGGAPDREGLNVPVLAAIGVGGRAELDLEGDVFAKIAIRVEAKGVETFVAEGVGRADAGVRIHGQSHHRCARAAAKQVEVADVYAGVFFCGRRIEMMRHGESSPKGLDARPKGRSLGCGVDGAIILDHCPLRVCLLVMLRQET